MQKILVMLTLLLFVTACHPAMGPKETGGALLGAGTGALIGSQIGGGRGTLVAVAVGTLAGALVGQEEAAVLAGERGTGPILQEIYNAIRAVAGVQGIKIVLNSQAQIAYHDSDLDITELVLRRLRMQILRDRRN